ncbi:RNA-binding region-containing protein 3 isoform X2 [Larimichthys crocea]|uniref:RNA-binding region-containing protein 3 isoform X2 n=1 Tax=Larimichthys crocea TaxID=215358 RepID=UPI000F5F0DAB|nr:RNA-binding region-containing protein 3 isoform X2 [Larimichthys crocea]
MFCSGCSRQVCYQTFSWSLNEARVKSYLFTLVVAPEDILQTFYSWRQKRKMDKDEDPAQQNGSKTLLIRHLPAELSQHEKEDLLKYFGAESVRVFSNRGRLKHAAFATFRSEKSAAKALGRLHQLEILDRTLVVEFAKGQDHVTVLKDPPVSHSKHVGEEQQKQKPEPKQPNIPLIETGIAPSLGLKFQPNPTLKYLYPPPSNSILTNITHALMSVPKFYVQVLHLMNKMNLPCPFGPVTARPPMFEFLPPVPHMPMPPPFPPDYPPLPEEEMELSSQEESEYDSGDDEDKERIVRLMGLVNQACKRPLRPKTASKRKKPKIKDLLYAPKPDSQSAPVLQPSDVFEQPLPAGQRKIEFHISVPEVAGVVEGSGPGQPDDEGAGVDEKELPPSSSQEVAEAEGFGKLYPSTQPSQQQDKHSDEEQDLASGVISRKELEKGRLSRDEIKRMSVFKNYEPGEPTCRLYVKNIAKQVEEKDLKYIYGRYIDPSSETERNMFDIVLMKEGRMKGQAFVGLPTEQSAEKALRETNGYVLYDKPLVVQFARSARPKPDSTDTKRGPKQR